MISYFNLICADVYRNFQVLLHSPTFKSTAQEYNCSLRRILHLHPIFLEVRLMWTKLYRFWHRNPRANEMQINHITMYFPLIFFTRYIVCLFLVAVDLIVLNCSRFLDEKISVSNYFGFFSYFMTFVTTQIRMHFSSDIQTI